MDHVEYVYTSGMTEADIDDRLRAGEHGVLGLAEDNEAYAIPLSYHYDGSRLLLRVSDHDEESEKGRFLETTETATFVCYEASTKESWSIHVRGPVEKWEADIDETTLNEWFQPFRVFDEATENVGFSLYDLGMETVIGRETVE
ncbi:pyridoxamine 5'-phosphate oxidase family protein [Haloarcula sp. 1CSR25-25]|uniref:pyridoxamine 5'-phosphate oxidase family protein n=1 Tax=Haloarcula sp. 1CSR25-25 TaxID=2862545 RepID=UPI002894890A|nr:pyridoxamine 5'-phosphate oxidase family protein [Haloarcula sp. 1CSR25-25]MDT3436039.1 pyridoxamine 5'-phosphate oxidase family protein [Haloarcula sp. 1CSR25-25]